MLADMHPGVRALDALPHTFNLIGSRSLGMHKPDSDYDYLLVVREFYTPMGGQVEPWRENLTVAGFERTEQHGYGPDRAAEVWQWHGEGHPSIDVIVVETNEGARRLRFFRSLQAQGERHGPNTEAGKFYRAMKNEKRWPLLWAALRAFEGGK